MEPNLVRITAIVLASQVATVRELAEVLDTDEGHALTLIKEVRDILEQSKLHYSLKVLVSNQESLYYITSEYGDVTLKANQIVGGVINVFQKRATAATPGEV